MSGKRLITCLRLPLLLLLAAAILPCCSVKKAPKKGDRPLVIASIPPLEYFVREIGGEDVDYICMAPAGTDPETFEPSMAQLRDASKGAGFISTGLFPFEEKIAGILAQENAGIVVRELADTIDLITGTHGHDEADPHIWGSFRNARRMAAMTLGGLISIKPEAEGRFRSRFERLDSRLDSLDRATASRLATLSGKAFLVWHPSLSYFARDYNLRQIAVGHEHKESSATDLRHRLDDANDSHALIFFFQQEFDSRQSHAVTEATGLEPVTISPMSADVDSALIRVADLLAGASASAPVSASAAGK